MYNVSAEERDEIIRVLAEDESEAVGSMGDDTPMPVLSKKVRSLYDYFRQQFAQVTNPPIDSLRESIVMSLQTQIGPEVQYLRAGAAARRTNRASSPVLSQRKLRQIVALADSGVPNEFIDLQYDEQLDLKTALLKVCDHAETAVRKGKTRAAAVRPISGQGQGAHARAARHGRRASPAGRRRGCAASATSWWRPAPRAMRIISPA